MISKQRRTIPSWLSDEVKAIYRKLAEPLPPLDSIDETTLSQLAMLKHQLQADQDDFTAQQHSQLRQLTAIVRQWVTPETEPEEVDEFEAFEQKRKQRRSEQGGLTGWMKDRARLKEQYPAIR
ncbi:hypothetical protein [Endozoicomonas numazuensis]|uniref:Uncharacterized protein n=1 Tax=Endozoicomonas numazuensis TaxID=1137799 RepID=A0A081N681_9GAMM|nr:hypothetical protein [Endozoicomonas numazuensis]KEQ13954.1 hypothetical protein GZ78_25220 [Endozoicomonas numazuensis]